MKQFKRREKKENGTRTPTNGGNASSNNPSGLSDPLSNIMNSFSSDDDDDDDDDDGYDDEDEELSKAVVSMSPPLPTTLSHIADNLNCTSSASKTSQNNNSNNNINAKKKIKLSSLSFPPFIKHFNANFSKGTAVFLSIFLTNFLCMVFYLPRLDNMNLSRDLHIDEHHLCPDYGCIKSPPELTTDLSYLFDQIFHHEGQSDAIFDNFANPNMAMLTKKGNDHVQNQDRAIVIAPFVTQQTPTYDTSSFLMGIFDGHGQQGHRISQYVAQELPERLAEKFNEHSTMQPDDWIVQVLTDVFLELNENAPPSALFGGTTASVTLRRNGKLFFANTGDSQTILVTVDGSGNAAPTVSYMTRKDKAHIPEERARIEGLGGTIHSPPNNPNMSRVTVYSRSAREGIALAMSRSIGDWEWKPIGVIPDPIVDVIDIQQYPNSFIIAASDGLWDTRKRDFFTRQFKDTFLQSAAATTTTTTKTPLQTCWETIEKVTPTDPSWYRDDITAIIMNVVPVTEDTIIDTSVYS